MKSIAKLYILIAGLSDTFTGLLLLLFPKIALTCMAIPTFPSEWIWMRFIGAFVFGIGSLYIAMYLSKAYRNESNRRMFLIITAWLRFVVGSFVLIAILSNSLSIHWISVTLTDLGFAAFQIFLLTRNREIWN
jgi:hypothetical protein